MTSTRWTDEQARERYGAERVLAMLNRPDETDEAACAHWFGYALLTLEARIKALEDDRLRWGAVMECEYRATREGFVHREDCRSCAKNVNALRGRITALEAERDAAKFGRYSVGVADVALALLLERGKGGPEWEAARTAQKALAEARRERDALADALYPMVVEALSADAREDAPLEELLLAVDPDFGGANP